MSKQDVNEWNVDDVSYWLESVGLGHKNDIVLRNKITGTVLVGATIDDLKSFGFSSLQARKIEKEIAAIKHKVEKKETSSLEAENLLLRQELDSLKCMVLDLKKQVDAQQTASNSSNALSLKKDFNPSDTAHRVEVAFCTRTYIEGNQTQYLSVTLSPGESVRAEPGAMVHLSSWIEMTTKTDGQGLARLFTGQRLFLTEFSYRGPAGTADTVAFTPDFPGQIIPIRLDDYGRRVICQQGSLLASASTVEIMVEFTENLGAGFFGGEGFMLQGLYGTGMAFLNARGAIIKKVLTAGERLTAATGALVAFQSGVQYKVKAISGLRNAFTGGQGVFVTELVGPGTVWLETHDMSELYREMHREMR